MVTTEYTIQYNECQNTVKGILRQYGSIQSMYSSRYNNKFFYTINHTENEQKVIDEITAFMIMKKLTKENT
ncbi:MAG: hypothetical protein WCJ62_13460 [Flavobacterium sp.]